MKTPDIAATLESIKKSQENYRGLEDLFKQIDEPLDLNNKYAAYCGWSFPESVDHAAGFIHAQSGRNAVLDAKKQYKTAMSAVKKCNALESGSPLKRAIYRFTDTIGLTVPAERFQKCLRYNGECIDLLKNASKSLENAYEALIDESRRRNNSLACFKSEGSNSLDKMLHESEKRIHKYLLYFRWAVEYKIAETRNQRAKMELKYCAFQILCNKNVS